MKELNAVRKFLVYMVFAILFLRIPICVYAHPGGTDSRGGHHNRSTGEYHYHHGYSEHQHSDMDGDGILECPYEFNDKTSHNTIPQYTIDPKLIEEMEEWHQKIQEYTYPEEYTRIIESKENEKKSPNNNDHKVTLKTAISNNSSKSSSGTNLDWYNIPMYVIGISAFFMIFSPVMDYLRPGLTEYVFDFSLKAIIFALPFELLFGLLFMIFE